MNFCVFSLKSFKYFGLKANSIYLLQDGLSETTKYCKGVTLDSLRLNSCSEMAKMCQWATIFHQFLGSKSTA